MMVGDKTMMVGDKTLAGDMNFDPLMISDSPEKLAWYREAEVKHARLAMLAAFGWPVSELTNFGGLLRGDGRAPSLLNGGLGDINGLYWAAVVGLAVRLAHRTSVHEAPRVARAPPRAIRASKAERGVWARRIAGVLG